MSFGFGISDVINLAQLAYATFDGAKRACGEHHEITQEFRCLVTVLDDIQSELSDRDSPINMARGHRRKDLKNHIKGCLLHVRQMNAILAKYNGLSDEERGHGSFWQKVRFGNGPVKDIAQIRDKIATYTNVINMSLTLLSLGSPGDVERQLSRQRGELRGIAESVNMAVAKLNATSCEGSIYSKYTDDDVDFWRILRRQLVKKGYRSRVLRSSESLILAYVEELDSRGVFNGEMRRSRLSVDAEVNNDGSILPELGVDQVDVEADAQNEDEVSEAEHEEEDISGPPTDEGSWLGNQSTGNTAHHSRQPTVEDFEQLSEFDQQEGGESTQPLNDNGYAEDSEEGEPWQGEEDMDREQFSPSTSEIAQRIEYLDALGREEQELLRTMSIWEDTTNEQTSVYKLQSTGGNPLHADTVPNSQVHQLQAGDSHRSHLNEPRTEEIGNISTPNETSDQDVDTSLDREALAKSRDKAFRKLSSKEQKVIITLQDPTGRKYSLPFFLVKTWDGIQYLIEQAFLNIEDMGPRVAKGEYDLVNTDGAVIIPHLWETFVEPDMLVTMQMWPHSTPQAPPALPVKQPPPRVHWTPPPSPPRRAKQLPHLPPPRSSPRSSSKPRPVTIIRHVRSTSQTSTRPKSNQNASRQFAKWPLFWPSSPSKAKPKKLRRPLGPPPPPPIYMPSYDEDTYDEDTYDCDCWECRYPQTYFPKQHPVPYSFVPQFKAIYPQVTRTVLSTKSPTKPATRPALSTKSPLKPATKPALSTKSLTKATSDYDEDILDVSKVEPIFELEGEQIYELE